MENIASLKVSPRDGRAYAQLEGHWTLVGISSGFVSLESQLRKLVAEGVVWDLSAVERLDSVGALLLWRIWGGKWPSAVEIPDYHRHTLMRAEVLPNASDVPPPCVRHGSLLEWLGSAVARFLRHFVDFTALIGALLLDIFWVCAHPREIPLREFSATLYKAGALALPVTALVGFLIGVVISYLSSLQLQQFGAETFIVNILGMGIIRELGPVLVALLVAGRSGSAMTAQIGVMRVTEEIDALATMGVSRTLRLLLPKVAALSVAMPLLVVWSCSAAILGGLLAAHVQLDLSWGFFWDALPRAVPLANLWIGLGKGYAFGVLIGLVACHFGLRVKPNTESLSSRTTSSVVTSITGVILIDAIFAILTRSVGLPPL